MSSSLLLVALSANCFYLLLPLLLWLPSGLQLRTFTHTSQDTQKAFACGFSANASTDDDGSHLEPKLENPGLSSDNNIAHVMEDAVQSERSEDTKFEAYVKAGRNSNVQYSHFISLPLAPHQALLEQLRSFREFILGEEQKVVNYVSWFPETAEKENSSVATINTTNKVTKIKSSYILDPDLERIFSDDESSDDDENEHPGSKSTKISNSLFLRPKTTHITVLMLKLFTDDHVNVATEVLQGVESKVLEILDGQEPKVLLKGIECLRGNPAKAQVLSMKVQEADNGNRLHRACQAIKDAYTVAGLVAKADTKLKLKLHATVMNTSFIQRRRTKSFDARKILAKYQSQEWGEYSINEVHLSQRFVYDESGYYRCCSSFQLPSTVSQSTIQAG